MNDISVHLACARIGGLLVLTFAMQIARQTESRAVIVYQLRLTIVTDSIPAILSRARIDTNKSSGKSGTAGPV